MNVPNINIKDILAKLSVLKNNLSLVVPILIAIVGLLLVIPTRILSARLRATVEKNSVSVGTAIDRTISDLSPGKLKTVSQKQLDAVAQDANQAELLVTDRASRRELLSYSLFPDTTDQSRELFTEFGQRYRQGVAAMLRGLNASESPTPTEIQTVLTSVLQAAEAARLGVSVNVSRTSAMQLTLESMTDAQRRVFDQLCKSKATAGKVYANPEDIAGCTFWEQWTFGNDPNVAYRDCWYWQLGYWIVEDVVATIGQMNGSAESVLTAPVKRLMSVSFVLGGSTVGVRPAAGTPAAALAAERPAYVTGLGKGLVTPCTARICGEAGDVVQFEVQVVVDSSQVLPFMQALCSAKAHRYRGPKGNEPEQSYEHNQITILEVTADPVESTRPAHLCYRYGDRPVSRVDLMCEYLLPRTSAYQAIKPRQAREDLGEPLDVAAAPAPESASAAAATSTPKKSTKRKD
jgi:hypothetical protein